MSGQFYLESWICKSAGIFFFSFDKLEIMLMPYKEVNKN